MVFLNRLMNIFVGGFSWMKMMLCNVGNFDFLCDVDFNFMKIVVIGMVNFYGIFI